MEEIYLKYGLGGVGIAALVIIIKILWKWLQKQDEHKNKQIEDAKQVNEKLFERLNDITDETNKVLRENTNILTGLKTLLENRK